jgi:hypothetical protein
MTVRTPLDDGPTVHPRRFFRRRRRGKNDDPKPAWALAGLFAVMYLIGKAVENGQLVIAVIVLGGFAAWLLAVLIDASDVRSSGAWIAFGARRHLRREARRARRS